MNKILVIVVGLIIVVAGGWYVVTKHSSKMSPMASPASSSSQATTSVTIQNFAFSPASITVKKGATVTWTNQDTVGHTVTETDGQPGPSSATLDQGKSYSFTYATAGTFHYHCSVHPEMTGTVTVTD